MAAIYPQYMIKLAMLEEFPSKWGLGFRVIALSLGSIWGDVKWDRFSLPSLRRLHPKP